MVRVPKSGNGTRSPVYYLDSASLVPPRPRAQALHDEMDPLAAGVQADGSLAADIYICRFAAVRNARAHAVPVREELLRLVIHGTLHVLGWDHPHGTTRTRSPMWRRQERYLANRR